MKKRFALLALVCALVLSTAAQAESVEAAQPLSPYQRTRAYQNQFSDVNNEWYAASVAALYEYGLTEGKGGNAYAPNEGVTVAELVTFSARLRSIYLLGAAEAGAQSTGAAGAWYAPYVAYLKAEGVLSDAWDGHYTEPATRAQMAGIFAVTLPEEWYDGRNDTAVTQGYAARQYIKDVDDYTPYQQEILWLYKQGILSGMDGSGAYHPQDAVKRSEIAALLTRMVDPALRLTLEWPVLEYTSAAGTSYAALIDASGETTSAPESSDEAAIDALIRQMLRAGESAITLQYDGGLTAEETAKLTRAFTSGVKRYCEQMYNAVTCRAYASGRVHLTFGSTACDAAQLQSYREETMARAIAVHDGLWESGYLTADMNQYEIAKAYYVWLCENCVYDDGAVGNDSISHLAYGALVEGVAVCDGYTGAYNLLLKLEGIPCTALFNATHIWTVAMLDGVTYHIDTTWGDQEGRMDLDFFGMSEEQSRAKHAW